MLVLLKEDIKIENPVKSGNCTDWFTPPLPPTIFLEINYLIGFQIYIPQNLGVKKNKNKMFEKNVKSFKEGYND